MAVFDINRTEAAFVAAADTRGAFARLRHNGTIIDQDFFGFAAVTAADTRACVGSLYQIRYRHRRQRSCGVKARLLANCGI